MGHIMNSPRELEMMAKRIVTVSDTYDPQLRLPIIVMDSTSFPVSSSKAYITLIPYIIDELPDSDYVLLFFACGAPNKPSWSWVTKTYGMLETHVKKRVKKIYVVHESWWVRAVNEMLGTVISAKFKNKVVHNSDLSDLAKHVDITKINIPQEVYLHDRKVEDTITVPRHCNPTFGSQLNVHEMPYMWNDLLAYLGKRSNHVEGLFRILPRQELLDIVKEAYDRGQLIHIKDYGPHVAASLLKLYLRQLPVPVIELSKITLPIEDTPEYCLAVLRSIPRSSLYIIKSMIALLVSITQSAKTKQTAASLSTCVAQNFIGATAITKESVPIVIRFVKNLIKFGSQLEDEIRQILKVNPPSPIKVNNPNAPEPHNPFCTPPSKGPVVFDMSPLRGVIKSTSYADISVQGITRQHVFLPPDDSLVLDEDDSFSVESPTRGDSNLLFGLSDMDASLSDPPDTTEWSLSRSPTKVSTAFKTYSSASLNKIRSFSQNLLQPTSSSSSSPPPPSTSTITASNPTPYSSSLSLSSSTSSPASSSSSTFDSPSSIASSSATSMISSDTAGSSNPDVSALKSSATAGAAPRPPPSRQLSVTRNPSSPLSPLALDSESPTKSRKLNYKKSMTFAASPFNICDEQQQPPVPPEPRKFGPGAKLVVSTKRGKKVNELTKLYEEKSKTAPIVVAEEE